MNLLHRNQQVTYQSVLNLRIIFIIFLTTSKSFGYVQTSDNALQKLQDFDPDIEPYDEHNKATKHIFDYQKNGVRLDVNVVPVVNNTISEKEENFPIIPFRDLGRCVLNLSLSCFKERIARYIDTIGRLNQITLFGNTVKFVKVRSLSRRNSNSRAVGTNNRIDQSIDDFFDKFALRITIPRSNKKKEQSQIDLMFDDTDLVEGRGKGGGGGGGKGGKGCKQMMMCMMMGLKMKMLGMMGLMAMKGMAWAGMSMMLAKGMIIMKMMKGGGGDPWQGGGGGGGKAPLKEIVLLTKASGGGGGGGGYAPPPPAPLPPPPTSYGPPAVGGGGGGGYDYSGGGGGGWGRSFDNRLSMTRQTDKYSNPQQIADNLSIVNTHSEIEDKFNDWESKNYLNNDQLINQEHIGEVFHINQPKESDLLLINDAKIGEEIDNHGQAPDAHENLNFDESKAVYANYWKNYEAADRIWDMKGPIVARRIPVK